MPEKKKWQDPFLFDSFNKKNANFVKSEQI